MNKITVPLTDQEAARLTELAAIKGLSEDRLLVQALRLYDCIESGGAELFFKKDPNFFMDSRVERYQRD